MKFVEEIIIANGVEATADNHVLVHPDAAVIPQASMGVVDPYTRQLVTNVVNFQNGAAIPANPIQIVSWVPYPVGFGQFNPVGGSWTVSNNIFLEKIRRILATPYTIARPQITEFIPGIEFYQPLDPNTTYAIGIKDISTWEIEEIVYAKRLYTYRPTGPNEVWGMAVQAICQQINNDKTYNVFATPFDSEVDFRYGLPLNSVYGNSIRFIAADKQINNGIFQNAWYNIKYRFEVTAEIPDNNIIHHPVGPNYPFYVPNIDPAYLAAPALDQFGAAPVGAAAYQMTIGQGYFDFVNKLERDNLALKGHIYPNWQYDPQAYSNVPVLTEILDPLRGNVFYDQISIEHFHRPLVESYSIREMPIRTNIFFARPVEELINLPADACGLPVCAGGIPCPAVNCDCWTVVPAACAAVNIYEGCDPEAPVACPPVPANYPINWGNAYAVGYDAMHYWGDAPLTYYYDTVVAGPDYMAMLHPSLQYVGRYSILAGVPLNVNNLALYNATAGNYNAAGLYNARTPQTFYNKLNALIGPVGPSGLGPNQ